MRNHFSLWWLLFPSFFFWDAWILLSWVFEIVRKLGNKKTMIEMDGYVCHDARRFSKAFMFNFSFSQKTPESASFPEIFFLKFVLLTCTMFGVPFVCTHYFSLSSPTPRPHPQRRMHFMSHALSHSSFSNTNTDTLSLSLSLAHDNLVGLCKYTWCNKFVQTIEYFTLNHM